MEEAVTDDDRGLDAATRPIVPPVHWGRAAVATWAVYWMLGRVCGAPTIWI